MACNPDVIEEVKFLSKMKKQVLEFVEKQTKEEEIEQMEYTYLLLYNLIINVIYFSSNRDLAEAYPSNLLVFLEGLTKYMSTANKQHLSDDEESEEITKVCEHDD